MCSGEQVGQSDESTNSSNIPPTNVAGDPIPGLAASVTLIAVGG